MKILFLLASPRLQGNTATLLARFEAGVHAVDPQIETPRIPLYGLSYSGCRSCFACKREGTPAYGHCVWPDEAAEVLRQIETTDGLVIGAPIYLGALPGQLTAFMERCLFAKTTYEAGYRSLMERRLPVCTLYTMNATESEAVMLGIPASLDRFEGFVAHVFGGEVRRQMVFNTCQFEDYSRYRVEVYSAAEKMRYRQTHFPTDLATAFENGQRLAGDCLANGTSVQQ